MSERVMLKTDDAWEEPSATARAVDEPAPVNVEGLD
jgi:hypothetical protein